MEFDPQEFSGLSTKTGRYEKRLKAIEDSGKETGAIKIAVEGALESLSSTRSFVIYGEPQSGKTEMMIALTAKLLDQGHTLIIHLLNDSVQLLSQNLDRFKRSKLAPSPVSYKDILDPDVDITSGEFVVFCKKNSSDLKKLINKVGHLSSKIIIDDEADYATPNAKVNKNEKTKINELIGKLLGNDGVYIGVTATPARLDLNRTFENESDKWVDFPPHSNYTGQNIFFPIDHKKSYRLEILKDQYDDPKHARTALLGFLVNVAYLNLYQNDKEQNYSMLVHTSGKKVDHSQDRKTIQKTLSSLTNEQDSNRGVLVKQIWDLAKLRHNEHASEITKYVLSNVSNSSITVMNSEKDKNVDFRSATDPAALFTIVIGGNIVSRGVTFENLLSMFFTRDVKHKIQQDTYIQRARMFGGRGKYLEFFELTIPEGLYMDWHRCFVFHRLSVEAIRSGSGSPVWLADHRISAAASSSIDKNTVSMDSGEMGFGFFDYKSEIEAIIEDDSGVLDKIESLRLILGGDAIPNYLLSFMKQTSQNPNLAIAIHPSSTVENYKDAVGLDKDAIERKRGFMGRSQLQQKKFPDAMHHLKVFFNASGKARMFYKFEGNIQFIKNMLK